MTMTKRADCYYQGTNELGEKLPSHIKFKPFFPFTFHVPVKKATDFTEILSWCNNVLDDKTYGRWDEDFEYWHLGDVAGAEAFRAAWIESAPNVDA